MRIAYSEIKPGKVTIEEVEDKPHLRKGLKCFYCRIDVNFVSSYTRKSGSETVRATFKKGIKVTHKDCPFNIDLQMTILARESDNNVFKSLENNLYEFRLNMIHDEMNMVTYKSKNRKQTTSFSPKNQHYVNKGKLSSYLSTMNKIIELRNLLANQLEEITSKVRIKYSGKEISWSKFYYDKERYHDAFIFLSKDKMPLCIEGKVHSIKPTSYNYAINLQQGSPYKENGVTLIPKVTIYFKEILKDKIDLNVGDHIAVSAIYKTKVNPWKKDTTFLNINSELYNVRQLHVFKEK